MACERNKYSSFLQSLIIIVKTSNHPMFSQCIQQITKITTKKIIKILNFK